MVFELRDLKWAIAVSHCSSLRKAAEALNVQQSTLSRALTVVEHYLGSPLFLRTNGGTKPTPAGLEFHQQMPDVDVRLSDGPSGLIPTFGARA